LRRCAAEIRFAGEGKADRIDPGLDPAARRVTPPGPLCAPGPTRYPTLIDTISELPPAA